AWAGVDVWVFARRPENNTTATQPSFHIFIEYKSELGRYSASLFSRRGALGICAKAESGFYSRRIFPFFTSPSSQRRAVAASGRSLWLFRKSRRVSAASS